MLWKFYHLLSGRVPILFVHFAPVTDTGLWGTGTAPVWPWPRDGAGDWRAAGAVPGQTTAHSGSHWRQEKKTAEFLNKDCRDIDTKKKCKKQQHKNKSFQTVAGWLISSGKDCRACESGTKPESRVYELELDPRVEFLSGNYTRGWSFWAGTRPEGGVFELKLDPRVEFLSGN